MKKLIIINGTMGVGKSTTCKALNKALDKSVFLDGDWCWNMDPFVVTPETKKIGMDNIIHILRSYLECSEFEHIVFCWVIHKQEILDEIIRRLSPLAYDLHVYTLMCQPEILRERLIKDIDHVRGLDVIEKSLNRIKLYEQMSTHKIDVSFIDTDETVEKICRLLTQEN